MYKDFQKEKIKTTLFEDTTVDNFPEFIKKNQILRLKKHNKI